MLDEKVMEMLARILAGQNDLQNELKQEIRAVSTKVDKLEMRMENEIVDKIKILFDAREVQNVAIANIGETLDRVEAKLDVLQLETAHIRRIK
ncbi:MAG: hypothetical protein P4L69_06790 [Desulfosporosinus sp.]|nr:hypothetical protein [Desulfosporosinus sp.]